MFVGKYNIIESSITSSGVTIQHFNLIKTDVVIKDNVSIGSYCEIEEGVVIGEDSVIQGRVRLGPYAKIGNGVIIKYGTIITDKAVIKDKTFIGPNVITLGAGADKKKQCGTVIGKNCFIGAGTKIAARVTICDNVVIGANSFVKEDITISGIYAGSPIRCIKILDKG